MEAPRPFPPHIEVRTSLIPGAGMGLFAKRLIKAGRKIGRYRGTTLYKHSASDTVPESHKPYLIDTIENGVIDGYTERNHMRWVNHSTSPNAYAHLESDGVIFFIALKNIKAGDEIYIDYGYDPNDPPK